MPSSRGGLRGSVRGRDALGPKDYSIWCKTDSRWLLWNWQCPGLSAVS